MKEENATAYKPIDCNLYDVLLEKAVLKISTEINYIKDGRREVLDGLIIDVFTKEGIEYLQTDGQDIIRLDNLISVGSISFEK